MIQERCLGMAWLWPVRTAFLERTANVPAKHRSAFRTLSCIYLCSSVAVSCLVAAETPAPDPEALVRALGSDDFDTRRAAAKRLEEIG